MITVGVNEKKSKKINIEKITSNSIIKFKVILITDPNLSTSPFVFLIKFDE